MKEKIAIAISGGIDSLVSAYLLKDQGYDIFGIHFVTGYEPKNKSYISSTQNKILNIGKELDIVLHILDCRKDFENKVINYFLQTYQGGQTPNPCMVCNPRIKFGTVLKYARKLGASYLATGHYAKLTEDNEKRFHLLRSDDSKKDQSYFLALLTQKQLSAAKFPVGSLTKNQVLELAKNKGLKPLTTSESQDICFIHTKNYNEFLGLHSDMDDRPGPIENMNGKVIGQHKGLHRYTVGQRRGIDCPAKNPYYVIKLDTKHNRLIVGDKEDLLTSEFKVNGLNWIIKSPKEPIDVHTRVRYRSKAFASIVFPVDKNTAWVRFNKPQLSVAPGQAAVFYKNDEVLGGGWILPYQ